VHSAANDQGCHIASTHQDHFESLCSHAIEKSEGDRQVPVLVLVKEERHCAELKSHIERKLSALGKSSTDNKCQVIHRTLAETKPEKFERRVQESTTKRTIDDAGEKDHRITISTPYGGRGVDYRVVDDVVDQNGGLLVIIGYLPPSERDHVQFLGRTGRQDKYGQYTYILNRSDYPGVQFDEGESDDDEDDEGALREKFGFAHFPSHVYSEGSDLWDEPQDVSLADAKTMAMKNKNCVGFTFQAPPEMMEVTDDSELSGVLFKQAGAERQDYDRDEEGYEWHAFVKFKHVGADADRGEVRLGYLRADEDPSDCVKEETMTWAQAIAFCENTGDCKAFTCQAASQDPDPGDIVVAMFKSHQEFIDVEWPQNASEQGWLTYVSAESEESVAIFELPKGERKILDMGNLQSDQKLSEECDEIEKGEGEKVPIPARLLCVLLTHAAACFAPEAMNAVCDLFYERPDPGRREEFLALLKDYAEQPWHLDVGQIQGDAHRMQLPVDVEQGKLRRDFAHSN
jgi:hypothetical protein